MRFTFKHQPRPALGEAPARLHLVPSLQAVQAEPEEAIEPEAPAPRLGVWCLRRPLHRSATGPWYLAEHALASGQQAAVIVFEQSDDAAALMLRFADAVAELANLHHHHIVTPIDSGLTPQGQPFLVLPWVEAEPLLQAIENLGLRERLTLLQQLCDALAHAHSEGLLLQELDPAQLWVLPDGRLQLMAVQLGREPRVEAPPEALRAYASPERLAGVPAGFASEAYAIGALMHQLAEETRSDPAEGASLDWPELDAGARRHLALLMAKATSPDLSERHPNTEALGLDLRAWLAWQGPTAATARPAPPPSFLAEPKAVPRWRRWFPVLIAVTGLALLAVGWAAHPGQWHSPPELASSAEAVRR